MNAGSKVIHFHLRIRPLPAAFQMEVLPSITLCLTNLGMGEEVTCLAEKLETRTIHKGFRKQVGATLAIAVTPTIPIATMNATIPLAAMCVIHTHL